MHIVWAEKTFFLIFRVRCCYFNFWMPKKSQNSTFFFKSSSIHCWWFSTKTLTLLYKKKPRLIGFIEKMDQNLWIYQKIHHFCPKFTQFMLNFQIFGYYTLLHDTNEITLFFLDNFHYFRKLRPVRNWCATWILVLLGVQSLNCQTAKNSGEPQKMTHNLETEFFLRVVRMGKL